jgi:hypothetical protein
MKMMKKPAVKKMAVKKAQNGKMTPMQKLKKMYPSADTTAAGDTRFEEYNAYAPKKFLDKVNATDKAFDDKYGKGKPAVDKPKMMKKKAKMGISIKKKMQAGGVAGKQPNAGMVDPKGAYTKVQMRTLGNMKNGGMKKAQTGIVSKESSNVLSKIPAAGAMKKTKSKERSADGNYMAKTVTRETPEGKSSTTKTRRTAQGILRGAPSVNKYKGGGKMKKAMSGTSLKPVDKKEKPGLAKLPTAVRNKMGYQKMGGKTSKKK